MKRNDQNKSREVPFKDLQRLLAENKLTRSEWRASIDREARRRLSEALPGDYVAIPQWVTNGTWDAMVWYMLGPEVPRQAWKIDRDGKLWKRQAVSLTPLPEGEIATYEQPAADDLAAALTVGRRARERREV